ADDGVRARPGAGARLAGCLAAQLDLTLTAQHGPAVRGQREGRVLGVGREESLCEELAHDAAPLGLRQVLADAEHREVLVAERGDPLGPLPAQDVDRKSTRLNSSHVKISYAVFCLKK